MDTKWRKSRAFFGFLAFALGVSLLLEGALYFGTALTSSVSRRWVEESFQSDWRDSREFKDFVCGRLETLITMGAGGNAYRTYYGYYSFSNSADTAYNYSRLNEARNQALHNDMKEDKNVLYTVSRDGTVLYSNNNILLATGQRSPLTEGYSFLLQFDGEKVRIWKDGTKNGTEVDVYGDGYYRYDEREDSYQWYVPGYKNFTVDEAGSKVKVTMAVIDTPQIFIKGSYGASGSSLYNKLYYLKQNLEDYRAELIGHAVRMGVGLALFLAYVFLRKDKKRADQALARGTGRVWFEVKLLAAVLLVVFFLPRPDYFGDIWAELTYAYSPAVSGFGGSTSAAAAEGIEFLAPDVVDSDLIESGYYDHILEQQALREIEFAQVQATHSIGTAVTVLSENGGWLLREYLGELSRHMGNVLEVFWGLYFLVFNDWRYNKRPWKQGVVAILHAGTLKYPLQKRLRRDARLVVLAFVLLGGVAAYLVLAVAVNLGRIPIWWLAAVGVPCALAVFLAVLVLIRQRRLWTDFGAVADHASAIRTGALDSELTLPPNSGLGGLADDLNHIRQGLHQAVEERTQSERMKVELVTNVSHDLKTPLTSILSYTELLAQEPLEPPASEYVKIMGEKAQRLKAMVQDVFEVSKAASGQLPVKLERLDYARLLRQTLADMAQAIEDSGLTLRSSIPEGEVPITADSDRLYRVFQNLIGNALKYSLAGSRVYLSLTVADGKAAASIRNTSAAELKPGADYTARFVRGDESRSDGGSGLGLSIAESFTRACGGELAVTTDADLFTAVVTFPMAEE